MDTRRMPERSATAGWPDGDALVPEVEIVELGPVKRDGRGLRARLAFVVGIALLAGLVAMGGLPSRSTFALDQPLGNFLTPTLAP
jgi:hypothetical protein